MTEPSEIAGPEPVSGTIDAIARGLAILGGAVMLCASAMVTLSVILRWLRNDGIQGDFEMMQIATAVGVFCFLPLCQLRRGNVFVDTFTQRAPEAFNRWIDALWDLVFGGFAGLIAWRLSLGAMDAIQSRTTSMVLGIPVGWAIAVTAALAGFLCVVCLFTAIKRVQVPA